jgi:plasmid stabilization system protein ParE
VTPRRAYLRDAANTDLLDIFDWIATLSQDVGLAQRFVERLRERCDELAALFGPPGRERDELGPGLRSVAWKRYVIVFRYGPTQLEVVRILHGRRDIAAAFDDQDGHPP